MRYSTFSEFDTPTDSTTELRAHSVCIRIITHPGTDSQIAFYLNCRGSSSSWSILFSTQRRVFRRAMVKWTNKLWHFCVSHCGTSLLTNVEDVFLWGFQIHYHNWKDWCTTLKQVHLKKSFFPVHHYVFSVSNSNLKDIDNFPGTNVFLFCCPVYTKVY